jgi:hypothetical protein
VKQGERDMATKCICCGVQCDDTVLPLPVDDLQGSRAGDAVCSFDCEDMIFTEDHHDGCECNACWRVSVRAAHTAIEASRAS